MADFFWKTESRNNFFEIFWKVSILLLKIAMFHYFLPTLDDQTKTHRWIRLCTNTCEQTRLWIVKVHWKSRENVPVNTITKLVSKHDFEFKGPWKKSWRCHGGENLELRNTLPFHVKICIAIAIGDRKQRFEGLNPETQRCKWNCINQNQLSWYTSSRFTKYDKCL